MNDDNNSLLKVPIFSTLSEDEVKEIQSYLIRHKFRKKEDIFSEGDPSEWFYILMSGKVKITKLSLDGREIIVELISPADFFGGFAVLKGFPYPANAIAMEDSDILKISRHNLLMVLERFPNIMYEITSSLGDRMREFHDTLKNIALERVESRIASLFLKLADKIGEKNNNDKSILIDMRLTKQDIAEMVGTTVETTIRIISRFKKTGIVTDTGGKIIIKDMGKLKEIVSL